MSWNNGVTSLDIIKLQLIKRQYSYKKKASDKTNAGSESREKTNQYCAVTSLTSSGNLSGQIYGHSFALGVVLQAKDKSTVRKGHQLHFAEI